MKVRILVTLVAAVALCAPTILADDFDGKALTASAASIYGVAHNYLIRAAEKMPADDYGFRPTPEVRTFGEILAHVADGNRLICGMAVDDRPTEMGHYEKTAKTKEQIIAALNETAAYCKEANAQLAGARGAEMVDFFGGMKQPRIGVLYFNGAHAFEHYGNVVTYMRIRGLVPPSSEPRP